MTHPDRPVLVAGDAIRAGTQAPFRSLVARPRDPRAELADLAGLAPSPPQPLDRFTSVARFVHVSDLHITDVESPARLDFMIDDAADPRYEQALPVPRPQQLLSTHAAAAAVDTIGRLGPSAESGRPVEFVVLTGDLVDNAQRNELDRLEAVLRGAEVRASSWPGVVEGTETADWRDAQVWQPADAAGLWATRYGFPHDPGLLAAVSTPFTPSGLTVPAILARGNHDALLAGTVAWTAATRALAAGGRKVRGLPPRDLLDDAAAAFRADPDAFFTGRAVPVTPDPSRRPIAAAEFARTIGAPALDAHGHDFVVAMGDRLRVVVLDTVDDHGHPDGVVTAEQYDWLARVLDRIAADPARPLVVVASHHGPLHHHTAAATAGRVTGAQVVQLLGRHEQVVLWLTGHTHYAEAIAHRAGPGRGFWEVTAPAIVDWPCQLTTVEVFEHADGSVAVTVDKHDLAVPASPDGADAVADLASLHRLLAANQADFGRIFPGPEHDDRRDLLLRLGPPHGV
ncbi:metallophosphoesterase [Jiangella anatolica]|uniref:metallophosphoesterase n=1 Tax=Jiangella anatolica TaxID=2670374 RepID=UPI0013149374|nr:metallophosphoesterase [Jiangella anatolica]